MDNFLVWIDGIMSRSEGVQVRAKGYKSAIRKAVKNFKPVFKDKIKRSMYYTIDGFGKRDVKFWFHVEKLTVGKENRLMYMTTLGKKLGIKKIR